MLINTLSPAPKLQGARSRTRKAESSAVVTSSPFENAMTLNETGGTKRKRVTKGISKTTDDKGKGKAPVANKRKKMRRDFQQIEREMDTVSGM